MKSKPTKFDPFFQQEVKWHLFGEDLFGFCTQDFTLLWFFWCASAFFNKTNHKNKIFSFFPTKIHSGVKFHTKKKPILTSDFFPTNLSFSQQKKSEIFFGIQVIFGEIHQFFLIHKTWKKWEINIWIWYEKFINFM